MLIVLLFILLLFLSITIFLVYKRDILEPSLIFCLSFLALSFMACLNAKKWQLGLHLNTFLVILLGVIEFFIAGLLVKYLLKNKKVKTEKKLKPIEINNFLEYIILLLIIAFDFVFLYFVVMEVGNSFTSISTIVESIHKYDSLVKFSNQFNNVRLPFVISNGRVFIIAFGYWFIYVVVRNYIVQKRVFIREVLIIIFILILTLLTGSRTELFFMILSGIVYYFCIYSKKNGFPYSINKKSILSIVVIFIALIGLLIPMANLLGRKVNKKPFEYVSIYCGAQVKNLDIFLQNKNSISKNTIWGSQTFNYLVKSYGEKIGFKGYEPYRLDLPFQKVGDNDLGNVYTTFYPYIYDFGYLGEFILILIMSIISHLVYENIKIRKVDKNYNVLILSYGIIASSLALSFFSNKFYEHIFTFSFIKYLLSWFVINYLFISVNNKKRAEKNEKIN